MVPERIALAGDWHGNTAWAVRAIRKMATLLPQDGPRVIVHLGDFGIWPGAEGREYLSALDAALAAADAELWFVDGNHEDFTQLARLTPGPDGREQVTGRIWHLPRGHRWRWHGRDWLALGGAVSLDRAGRTAGIDWWPEEEITRAQARSVMDAGPADVMVTHECPAGVEHVFPPPPSWWSPWPGRSGQVGWMTAGVDIVPGCRPTTRRSATRTSPGTAGTPPCWICSGSFTASAPTSCSS